MKNEAGFTLIELLVVIIIITTLTALIIPRFFGRTEEARQSAARADIESLGISLDMYQLDNMDYPSSEQGLKALREKPTIGKIPKNWKGPYLKKDMLNDPWQNPYIYRCPGMHNTEGYDLESYGKDGRDGGEKAEISKIGSLKGFTLIELLVIILVMSVMAVVSAPMFSHFFSHNKLKAETSRIVATLNYARSVAVAEGVNCRISFDLNTNRYWLEKDQTYKLKIYSFEQGVFIKCIMRKEEEILQGTCQIAFNPNGTVSDNYSIFIRNEVGEIYSVELSRITGISKIEKHSKH